MSLLDDVTAALPDMRRQAESLMLDRGTMRRANGGTTQDPDSGTTVPTYDDLFTSNAKIQTRNLQARESEVGGRTSTSVRVELHLPVSAPAVETGDVWEVTRVNALSDVQLLGRKFRVIAPVGKSFATARRLEVEEIVS